MDRLAALFEQLSLPEIARVLRRAVIAGIVIGAVALIVTAIFGRVLIGLGVVIGLGVGLVNIRLITRSVAKVNEMQPEHPKRVLASRTLTRLSLTTIIVIGLIVASLELGFGTAGGIAIFYFILLVSLIRSLLSGHGMGAEA